jgi:hypothetical protein
MSSIIFNCEFCEYKTKKKYNFNRHQITVHHKNVIKEEVQEEIEENKEEIEEDIKEEENKEEINKNIINENKEFIYLLQEREFIKTKEPIYKIGKTKQERLKRIKSYPNGSELLFYIVCNNCDKIEKIIINKFKNHFIHKKEFGNEYFMGDYNSMIDTIYNIIRSSKTKDIKDIIEDNRCSKCNKFYKTKKVLINHEKSCNGLSILTCPKCMITFSSRFCKSSHMKRNNCKAKSINNNIDDYINDFGNERIDYLENFLNEPDIKDLPIHKRLIKYIEYKYFNEEFPENKNITYKNNNCLIKEDGKWKPKHINNMITDIIEKNKLIIYTNEDNDDDNDINDNYIKNELKILIKSSKNI